jgi:glycosyltransferase involved in cell wall biosynthesis
VAAVQILLATFNGMRFLPAQMESLAAQTWPEIDLLISDDGSSDGTWDYLTEYCAAWTRGRATLIRGPGEKSAAANFRHLILHADPDSAYFAYADQDDVWLPQKLARAVAALDACSTGPAVHCSRTTLIDADGDEIGHSPRFRRRPDFRNALVQSLAGGNTMVMNRPAFAAIRASAARTPFLEHDWWSYIIVSGAGGRMLYTETPDTLYRQHDDNQIGSNLGWRARWIRFAKLRRGRFRDWSAANIAGLQTCRDLLTPDTLDVLDRFTAARHGTPLGRLRRLLGSGVYRQTWPSQAMLYVAAVMGWV